MEDWLNDVDRDKLMKVENESNREMLRYKLINKAVIIVLVAGSIIALIALLFCIWS